MLTVQQALVAGQVSACLDYVRRVVKTVHGWKVAPQLTHSPQWEILATSSVFLCSEAGEDRCVSGKTFLSCSLQLKPLSLRVS